MVISIVVFVFNIGIVYGVVNFFYSFVLVGYKGCSCVIGSVYDYIVSYGIGKIYYGFYYGYVGFVEGINV